MRISNAATILRNAGLTVVETAGWKGRDNGREFDYIRGATIHHTAGSRNSSVSGELHTLIYGRPGLPGPISQFMVGRDGTWYCVADGCANHNKIGWAGPNKGYGNSHLIGVECQHSGGDEPWTHVQYSSVVAGTAALANAYHFTQTTVGGHKEHQPGEKVDPTFNMDNFRVGVRAALEGEEDDMLTPGEKWALHVINYRTEAIKANRAVIKVPARPDLGPEYTAFEEPNNLATAVAAVGNQVANLATNGVSQAALETALRNVLGSLS